MRIKNGAKVEIREDNKTVIPGKPIRSGEVIFLNNNEMINDFVKQGLIRVIEWKHRTVPDIKPEVKVSRVPEVKPTRTKAKKPSKARSKGR